MQQDAGCVLSRNFSVQDKSSGRYRWQQGISDGNNNLMAD
jgi:hypothetical protein